METLWIQAIALGAIQALTEFLPVSSSAHLLVIPPLFGWQHQGLFFDVALHWGTAMAVVIYFRKDWKRVLAPCLRLQTFRTPEGRQELHVLGLLGMATLPGLVVGLLFRHTITDQLRQPWVAAFCLAVFGILLVIADRCGRNRKSMSDLNLGDALGIGLAQALALIPGVSRSGITITAGRLLGVRVEEAARFSFLAATPLILGAALLESVAYASQVNGLNSHLGSVLLGTIVAVLAGFGGIDLFLKYLRKGGFVPFAVYRLVLAVVIWVQL